MDPLARWQTWAWIVGFPAFGLILLGVEELVHRARRRRRTEPKPPWTLWMVAGALFIVGGLLAAGILAVATIAQMPAPGPVDPPRVETSPSR